MIHGDPAQPRLLRDPIPLPNEKTPGETPSRSRKEPHDRNGHRFLLDNTAPDDYLLAVNDAKLAAPLMLGTDRPMLTFGGFAGSDPVMDADGVVQMVTNGKLRFVPVTPELEMIKSDVAAYVQDTCQPVSPSPCNPPMILTDCAPKETRP